MKQKSSKKDRVKELVEKKRYAEAIEILRGKVNRSHSNIDRRRLAVCQLEAQEFIDFFSTFHTIESKTQNDFALRDQAIAGLIGCSDQVSTERIDLIGTFGLDILRSGNPEEAGIVLLEAVQTWLQLDPADQERKDRVGNFEALLHAQAWQPVDAFTAQPENLGGLELALAAFCPADLDAVVGHLQRAEQSWQNELVYWKLFQAHLERREMPEAVTAYWNYLKRKPAEQPLRPSETMPAALKLTGHDAEQIAWGVIEILQSSQEEEGREDLQLTLLLECFGSLLQRGRHFVQLRKTFRVCPKWMFEGESELLPRLLIEAWLEDDLQQIEWVEKHFDAYRSRWPESGAMHFAMARYFYQKGELPTATPLMRKAIQLCPDNPEYQSWMDTLDHLEVVSLRLPSEQYRHLSQEEADFLRTCYGVVNFADIGRLAETCGIPVEQAKRSLHDFLITRMMTKVDHVEAGQELTPGFVTIGKQAYKIHADLLTAHARGGDKDRRDPEYVSEMTLMMPVISAEEPEVDSNIFTTQDEKLVYAALQRIFGSDDYTISINMNISILFDSEWAIKAVEKMKPSYYFQTSADFCVADKSGKPVLVVEVDGSSHSIKKRIINDLQKNMLFQKAGIPFLRIYNPKKDVFYLAEEIRGKLEPYHFFDDME